MDENQQDKTGSKPTAIEDVKWVFNKKGKLWIPKHKKWSSFAGKTFWDWLQLLIIPFFLAGATLAFNIQQNLTSNAIANDQQQEMILENYLDKMSDLLTNQHLKDPKLGVDAQAVAQARTLTALRRLDPDRKGILLQFLSDAGLINLPHTIISLTFVDLNHAKLSFAHLSCTDLSNTNLSGADLSGADLSGALLIGTKLTGADLTVTQFVDADLSDADLSGATMDSFSSSDPFFRGADFSNVTMPDGSRHPINPVLLLHPPCY